MDGYRTGVAGVERAGFGARGDGVIDRRRLVGGASLVALLGGVSAPAAAADATYGSTGKIKTLPGKRAAVAALILRGTADTMPGCRFYIVAEDSADPDGLWVVEGWDSKAAHDASLRIPAVRAAIAQARPMIAGFEAGAELNVIGVQVRNG